jgi:hypothetical protein
MEKLSELPPGIVVLQVEHVVWIAHKSSDLRIEAF